MISINSFEEISGLSEQIANTTENGILISLRGGTILSFTSLNTMPPPETFLSADEMELMRSFKSEKRRKEWCAGRLSAKRIISAVYGTEMRSMTVSYDEYHRPLCDGYLVSITHSVGLAAAAGAIGMGLAAAKSSESIARQPEAAGKINSTMMLGMVFIETAIIYALIVAILIIFVL